MYRVIFETESSDDIDRSRIKDGFQVAKPVSLAGGFVPREIQGQRFLWDKFWLSQDLETCCLILAWTTPYPGQDVFRIWKIDNHTQSLRISEIFEGRFRQLRADGDQFWVLRQFYDREKKRHLDFEDRISSWKTAEEVGKEEGRYYL